MVISCDAMAIWRMWVSIPRTDVLVVFDLTRNRATMKRSNRGLEGATCVGLLGLPGAILGRGLG